MPTPTTPTFTLTPVSASGYSTITIVNGATPPDHNDIYRFQEGESVINAIKLASNIIVNGAFTDHCQASGILYTYFVRAVAADSSFADSIQQSSTLTLSQFFIKAVTRNASPTNGIGPTVNGLNLIPESVLKGRESVAYDMGGAVSLKILSGTITQQVLNVTLRLTAKQQIIDLQSLFDSKLTLCFRDQKGGMVFGTMSGFNLDYEATYADCPLTVEENSYLPVAGTEFLEMVLQEDGFELLQEDGWPLLI